VLLPRFGIDTRPPDGTLLLVEDNHVNPSALLAIVLALTAAAPAQVRITEVLVDPLGPNAGAQIVELTNDLNRPVDLTGWYVSGALVTLPLPTVTLGAGGVARLHVGATGFSTPADLFVPGMPELPVVGTFTVHSGANPNDPVLLVDFVAWNGGQQNISTAVAAGQWPSTLVSVTLPAPEGATIAHYGASAFGGANEPDAWYQDTTPTVGLPNDPGSIFNLGMGCPGANPAPWIGLARPESRPWIGERLEIDLFNVPGSVRIAGFVIGARQTAPVLLDPFGLTGCAALVSLDVTTTVSVFAGSGVFSTSVPRAAALVGRSVYLQALVPWPGAPNPAQALMSNAIVCTVGSR